METARPRDVLAATAQARRAMKGLRASASAS
jgi:hypothetical protein